jgi:hypothetical protein
MQKSGLAENAGNPTLFQHDYKEISAMLLEVEIPL